MHVLILIEMDPTVLSQAHNLVAQYAGASFLLKLDLYLQNVPDLKELCGKLL